MIQRREVLIAAGGAVLAGCETTIPLTEVPPPEPPQVPITKVALASCADQTKPQPLWETVRLDKPDLVLFGGDNVYSNRQPWSADELRAAYAMEAAEPHFARLRRSVPHMASWDDNDYGSNDGGADFAHKAESKALFLDFWDAPPTDRRRAREGIHDAEAFGPPGQRVQVIMTDTRWFRSAWKLTDQRNAPGKERYLPDEDPARTMLGEAQWRWLEEQLRQPADVRLLFSGIQVVVDGHGWERWGNFPLERARLYRLIASTGARGVVFLSGDRHIGAIYRETAGTPYPFYELTSSGVTHPWAQAAEAGPNRIGELFTEKHYGTVEIDWAARALRLAIKDERGTVRRSQVVRLSELQAGG